MRFKGGGGGGGTVTGKEKSLHVRDWSSGPLAYRASTTESLGRKNRYSTGTRPQDLSLTMRALQSHLVDH